MNNTGNSSLTMLNNNSNNNLNSSSTIGSTVPDLITVPIVSLTIIFAVGCSIIVLARRTFRTNKLNWFIINLCATSTLFSSITLSMSILSIMGRSSSLSCRAQAYLTVMAACQMMYSHSAVAISRFLTIVYSNQSLFRSTAFICSCIAFGWFIVFLLNIPNLFLEGFACSNSKGTNFLRYYTVITALIIPATIILLCNIRIFRFVRQSTQRVHTEDRANNGSQARDVRLVKTMIVTYLVFVIGWLPLLVVQLFSDFITVPPIINYIFQVIPSLSTLFDVMLLIYTNQPMRLFLWELIKTRRPIISTNTIFNTGKTKSTAAL